MKIESGNSYLLWLLTCLAIVLAIISARIPALHWLSFFWIAPFAFVLPRFKLNQAVIFSTFFGTTMWIGTTYWLIEAHQFFANSAILVVVIVFLIFCLWQALPYIVLAASYSYFNWKKSPLGPLLASSTLTLAWVLVPSPLPWIPQNSLYVYPKFVALLDLSGMSLLLFLSTLSCFAIEYASRKEGAYKKHYMTLVLGIPVLMLGYGQIREIQLDHDKTNAGSGQWLHVGYIQPVLKLEDPFGRAYQLTEQLIQERHPDLIVWPEIASPFSFIDNQRDRQETLELTQKYQQDIITVSGYVNTREQRKGSYVTFYNQAQLIKDNRLQGIYSKEILVPFFEYMPQLLQFLRQWMPNVQNYQAGEGQQPLIYKENIRLVMAICYEIIFPEYIRRQIQQGGNIIINPVDDLAFKKGPGNYYHLSTAFFRSIENRVPWVRSTNTGISVIVGADGKPLTRPSELGAIGVDSARVFIPIKTSIYSRFGDWFTGLLIAAGLIYCAYSLRKPGNAKGRLVNRKRKSGNTKGRSANTKRKSGKVKREQ